MFTLSRSFLKFTAASSLLALTAISTPAGAYEMVQNLGPVGPNEPMLATIGSKHVVAFYVPGNGGCAVQAVIWNSDDEDAVTATSMWISLEPGQSTSIDSPDNKSLTVKCADHGEKLSAVDTNQQFASE